MTMSLHAVVSLYFKLVGGSRKICPTFRKLGEDPRFLVRDGIGEVFETGTVKVTDC